jgi:hypothetical protein
MSNDEEDLCFEDEKGQYDSTQPFNVVRTVALSGSIDDCVRTLAKSYGVSMGKVIRFFLVAGMLKYEWEPEELGLEERKA